MKIKDSIKALLKTTEAIIVFLGITLTVISPLVGPKVWAVLTAIGYLLVNVPGIIEKFKELIKKDGSTY